MKSFKFTAEQKEDLVKYMGCFLSENMKKCDPVKDSFLLLVDMNEFSVMSLDKEVVKSLIPVFGNYFPDILY